MWSWCYCSVLDRNYNLTSVNSNLFSPKSKSVTISAIFKNLYISSAKRILILALTEAQVQTQRYGDCRKAYPGAIHVQILLQVFTKGSKINNWMYFHSKSVTISAIFKNVYISFAKLIPILALKVTHQLRGLAITAKLTLAATNVQILLQVLTTGSKIYWKLRPTKYLPFFDILVLKGLTFLSWGGNLWDVFFFFLHSWFYIFLLSNVDFLRLNKCKG